MIHWQRVKITYSGRQNTTQKTKVWVTRTPLKQSTSSGRVDSNTNPLTHREKSTSCGRVDSNTNPLTHRGKSMSSGRVDSNTNPLTHRCKSTLSWSDWLIDFWRLEKFASSLNRYFSQITLTNRIHLYNISAIYLFVTWENVPKKHYFYVFFKWNLKYKMNKL